MTLFLNVESVVMACFALPAARRPVLTLKYASIADGEPQLPCPSSPTSHHLEDRPSSLYTPLFRRNRIPAMIGGVRSPRPTRATKRKK